MKTKIARTKADIVNDPRVKEFFYETDGCEGGSWWLFLKSNYISPDMQCHTIHEKTIKQCCDYLNRVVKIEN